MTTQTAAVSLDALGGQATAAALAWAGLVLALALPLTAPKLLVFALAHIPATRAGTAPH